MDHVRNSAIKAGYEALYTVKYVLPATGRTAAANNCATVSGSVYNGDISISYVGLNHDIRNRKVLSVNLFRLFNLLGVRELVDGATNSLAGFTPQVKARLLSQRAHLLQLPAKFRVSLLKVVAATELLEVVGFYSGDPVFYMV